jgi:threonine synthase
MMGLPFDKLICASNENNILTEFLNTGKFDDRDRKLKKTMSPAIDILVPSNIERLLYFITNDCGKVKKWQDELKQNNFFEIDDETMKEIRKHFIADYCSEASCLEYITKTYNENNILIDPHTAVAKYVADKYSTKVTLIAATAHYAKFPDTVCEALKIDSSLSLEETFSEFEKLKSRNPFHSKLNDVLKNEVIHKDKIEANLEEIKSVIMGKLISI